MITFRATRPSWGSFIMSASLVLMTADAIRLLAIVVPNHAPIGSTVNLSCLYELEGDTLYSLTWHHEKLDGDQFGGSSQSMEFYRITNRKPYKQSFPLPGIKVDMAASRAGTVVLKDVDVATSGKFICEISADITFQTLFEEAHMIVSSSPGSVASANGQSWTHPLVLTALLASVWSTSRAVT